MASPRRLFVRDAKPSGIATTGDELGMSPGRHYVPMRSWFGRRVRRPYICPNRA